MKEKRNYLLISSILLVALQKEVTAWIRFVPSSNPNNRDFAHAVTKDSNDNVIAAGITRSIETAQDITVVKFDGSGEEIWRIDINGADNLDDFFTAMALDPSENVILLGWSRTVAGGFGILVIKIEGETGKELWRRVISGPDNRNAAAQALSIESSGNVLLAATVDTGPDIRNFTLIKLNGKDGSNF